MESRYRQEVSNFRKKDVIIALCVFFGYIIFITAVVAIRGALSVSWQLDALITIATTAFPAAIVFLIVLRNKQGLSSIGLHKEKIWSAARLGLLFCLIPILFIAVIPGVSGGFNELLVGALLVNLVTTFFFAAHEDVIFVGFIQTRLYGFLKTDKAAIPAGAFLFALMHVPPWLMMGRFDADNLLVGIIQAFLAWFLMHLIFVSVFKKYHSLIPVFILHTVHNFSWNFAQTSFVRGIDFSFIMLLLYALAAGILFWRTRK